MKFCVKCGSSLKDMNFCVKCGTLQASTKHSNKTQITKKANPKILIIAICSAIILLGCIGFIFFFLFGSDNNAIGEEPITRGEWIRQLTNTMGYDKTNDADAYFSDVPIGSDIYENVQIAVAYRLLDLDSSTFNPDDYATREFVAVTSARAVGFFGVPSIEINDISGLQEQESIQLVAEFGLIGVDEDGNFLPQAPVSVEESREILLKIRDIITIEIDPNHVDVFTLQEDVIDISARSDSVTYLNADFTSTRVTNDIADNLEVGSIVILPPTPEFPQGIARKVSAITQDGNDVIVEYEMPDLDEVVSEIDIQGVYYPDFSNVIIGEDVIVVNEFDNEMGISSYSSGIIAQPLNVSAEPLAYGYLSFSFKIKGDDGEYLQGTLNIYELRATVRMQRFLFIPISAAMLIEESHSLTLSSNISFDKNKVLKTIPIPIGPTGVSVMVRIILSVDGEISFSLVHSARADIILNVLGNGAANSAQIHDIENYFRLEAKLEAGITLSVSLNILSLDLVEVHAFIGVAIEAETTRTYCLDITLYVPFRIGAALLPKLMKEIGDALNIEIKLGVTFVIWGRDNSPVNLSWHFEDWVHVYPCTRIGLSTTDVTAPISDIDWKQMYLEFILEVQEYFANFNFYYSGGFFSYPIGYERRYPDPPIIGLGLIDLNFDGIPELLVSGSFYGFTNIYTITPNGVEKIHNMSLYVDNISYGFFGNISLYRRVNDNNLIYVIKETSFSSACLLWVYIIDSESNFVGIDFNHWRGNIFDAGTGMVSEYFGVGFIFGYRDDSANYDEFYRQLNERLYGYERVDFSPTLIRFDRAGIEFFISAGYFQDIIAWQDEGFGVFTNATADDFIAFLDSFAPIG